MHVGQFEHLRTYDPGAFLAMGDYAVHGLIYFDKAWDTGQRVHAGPAEFGYS